MEAPPYISNCIPLLVISKFTDTVALFRQTLPAILNSRVENWVNQKTGASFCLSEVGSCLPTISFLLSLCQHQIVPLLFENKTKIVAACSFLPLDVSATKFFFTLGFLIGRLLAQTLSLLFVFFLFFLVGSHKFPLFFFLSFFYGWLVAETLSLGFFPQHFCCRLPLSPHLCCVSRTVP